ncbi:PRTRC system ParB family protein [Sphingomonas oryzagri]
MTTSHPGGATTLPLSRIRPGYNPRRYFDPAKHGELVASLRLRGMLQPILVRPVADHDDIYEIVAGGRRYRAALEAFGANGEVPVIIRTMSDQEALEAAIDENDVRDDASETEQADAAVRALAACGNDRGEAAARLGWSRAKLDRRLALAELSETVKRALDERRIRIGHAELLAAVPADKQDKALETILTSKLDVAKTRDLLMRVTRTLAAATFDRTECTTCPFNSAAQRALFETHVDDGHCTNPGCFGLKTEAAEAIRFEEQERAEKLARTRMPPVGDTDDTDADEEIVDATSAGEAPDETRTGSSLPPATPPAAAKPSKGAATPPKPAVTVKSLANRVSDLRNATWRTALARALAGNAAHAHTTILVAAMSGTLSQIKGGTLTARAGLLVGPAFPDLDYKDSISAIRALPDTQATTVLAAIGAAYAKDVLSFGHVADLACAFDVDIRDIWRVDKAFLERYTKDELKFIARECGLIAHLGAKAFSRLLASKKPDLIAGMLNATGFDWSGRLPGAMTLDTAYGPPPAPAAAEASPPADAIAA